MNKRIESALKAFVSAHVEGNAKGHKNPVDNVVIRSDGIVWKQHGNEIAKLERLANGLLTLTINDCGWQSNSTKARLNAILRHYGEGQVIQRQGLWYLTGQRGFDHSTRFYGTQSFYIV